MLCKIADLIVEVPAAGGMSLRCQNYKHTDYSSADIIIHAEGYRYKIYPGWDEQAVAYLESGWFFARELLRYNGFYLHSSAVELDGKAYLFSGPCGAGKSTHTRLWQQTFEERAKIFNDDKPALRRLEDGWYAYGTPWCGKDGININMKAPLAGICFLKQASENKIRRLNSAEAVSALVKQTLRKFKDGANTALLLEHLDKLVREIPVFELENRPEPAAAQLSYETMRRAAQEAGL